MNAASTDARETLAELLAAHSLIKSEGDVFCLCGYKFKPREKAHEHRADAILAAFPTLPVTRDDAKAEAPSRLRATPEERSAIADRLRTLANDHDQQSVYMLSYDADFIREVADRIHTAEEG